MCVCVYVCMYVCTSHAVLTQKEHPPICMYICVCMYVCACVYNTFKCVRLKFQEDIHIHTECIYTHAHTYIQTHIHTYTYTCIHAYRWMFFLCQGSVQTTHTQSDYSFKKAYIFIHECIYIYIYIYIHICT
jgi:hypothetical protein